MNEDRALITNLRERLDALSDSAIRKQYYEHFESRGFSPFEMRMALVGEYGMIASWFRDTRVKLGLSGTKMAYMLGYKGDNTRVQMNEMETGKKTIRHPQIRLMKAYEEGYRPKDWPS